MNKIKETQVPQSSSPTSEQEPKLNFIQKNINKIKRGIRIALMATIGVGSGIAGMNCVGPPPSPDRLQCEDPIPETINGKARPLNDLLTAVATKSNRSLCNNYKRYGNQVDLVCVYPPGWEEKSKKDGRTIGKCRSRAYARNYYLNDFKPNSKEPNIEPTVEPTNERPHEVTPEPTIEPTPENFNRDSGNEPQLPEKTQDTITEKVIVHDQTPPEPTTTESSEPLIQDQTPDTPDTQPDKNPCSPQTEICNGKDDDCDGHIDNGTGANCKRPDEICFSGPYQVNTGLEVTDPNSSPSSNQRSITRTKGFCIEKTEITQKEYQKHMGTNPSKVKGSQLPVTNISYCDLAKYANAKSKAQGLTECFTITTNNGKTTCKMKAAPDKTSCTGYYIPTKDQFTKAYEGPAAGGNAKRCPNSNHPNVNKQTWYSSTVPKPEPQPVGTKDPNHTTSSFEDIHDLTGNVAEYVSEQGSPTNYRPVTNPFREPTTQSTTHGGSYKDGLNQANCGTRKRTVPLCSTNTKKCRPDDVGGRLVRNWK